MNLAPIPSVYAHDQVEVVYTRNVEGTEFIEQKELVTMNEDQPLEMIIFYTADGKYIGNSDTVERLKNRGITTLLQPCDPDGTICSVGFNIEEQKWYGWSHRAIAGFTIGSEVSKGDCAYVPVDANDLVESIKSFWEHGIARPGGGCNEGMTFTANITNIRYDVELDGMLGLMYDNDTICSDPKGSAASSFDAFEVYPAPWGRGEWAAQTIDDAKEMAIAFARGVS